MRGWKLCGPTVWHFFRNEWWGRSCFNSTLEACKPKIWFIVSDWDVNFSFLITGSSDQITSLPVVSLCSHYSIADFSLSLIPRSLRIPTILCSPHLTPSLLLYQPKQAVVLHVFPIPSLVCLVYWDRHIQQAPQTCRAAILLQMVLWCAMGFGEGSIGDLSTLATAWCAYP